MTTTALVHIRCNTGKVRREKRDGRDLIIVPSATLPDNVVMNAIRYPAAVIAESFKSLEGTPAPLGHPMVNGKFVSARDPQGIVRGFFGSWNENVRREKGKVLLDKVIDVAFANQSEGGKRVLEAVDKGEPIHSSTGLLATLTPLENATDGAKFEADTMLFDHDCWLLDEPGAATPEQGVGIFVNAAGDEIEVINSTLEDDLDRDMDWQIDALLRTVERKKQLPLLERMKMSIMQLIQGDPTPDLTESEPLTANGDTMDKAQFDALLAKVDGLAAAPTLTEAKVIEIVGNALKPVTDAMAAQAAADKAKADTEHAELVNKVVEAGLLEESVAKEAAAPVLNALLSKQPATAFRVNGAFKPVPKATDRAALAPKGE
jgi:hypothetical protein